MSEYDEYRMVIKNSLVTIIKNLADGIVDGNTIVWQLTQQDTISLREDTYAEIQFRWRIGSFTDATPIYRVPVARILEDSVI